MNTGETLIKSDTRDRGLLLEGRRLSVVESSIALIHSAFLQPFSDLPAIPSMSCHKRNLIRRAAAHTRLSPYVISENSANSVTEHSLDNGVSDGLGWVGHRRIQVTIDVYGHL